MPYISVQDTTAYGTRVVINDLTFAANTYDYFEVEIWDFSNTVYSGSTVRWTESLTGNYAWTDIYGLSPSTGYTFKGFVKWGGGTRNHVGNVSFMTLSEGGGGGTDPDPNPRPSNWTWATLNPNSNTYTSGKLKVNLVSATEWNNFCSRIDEFRLYKNWSAYGFTTAYSTGDFTEEMYLEAYNAISTMTGVSQPTGFYSKLVALSDSLNSL